MHPANTPLFEGETEVLALAPSIIFHAPLIAISLAWLILPFFFLIPFISFGFLGLGIILLVLGFASILSVVNLQRIARNEIILTNKHLAFVEWTLFLEPRAQMIELDEIKNIQYAMKKGFLASLRVGTLRLKDVDSEPFYLPPLRDPKRLAQFLHDVRKSE